MEKNKILFVCTGNIFRSFSAHMILDYYIKKNKIKNLAVDSAGTGAVKQALDPKTASSLKSLGVKIQNREQKPLTKRLLDESDLVIVMADYHKKFIEENFGYYESVMFNEIANGKGDSVPDVGDVLKSPYKRKDVEKHIGKTVRQIYKNMPDLAKNIDRYLLFSDLLRGRKKHSNGLPFIPLHNGKDVAAFMSISIPKKEDGHILVIPKRRYSSLENIPSKVRHELIETVAKIGKALNKGNGGYNVLLNNGSDAGQWIFHTHFHIIPRNKKDGIKIELWKDKKLSRDLFVKLNKEMKELIDSV